MGTWNGFHNPIILIGGAVMIISTIALKINLVVQGNLYGETSLQPLAREGFLPVSLKKLNRDGLLTRAIQLNIVLTLGIIFIWLIIPDLIKGITLTCQDGFMCTLQESLCYP
ncbi:hypothetical protein [Spiroplasma mirum]|nr:MULTISPECIES: hypothetical protein [Spiroplasma]